MVPVAQHEGGEPCQGPDKVLQQDLGAWRVFHCTAQQTWNCVKHCTGMAEQHAACECPCWLLCDMHKMVTG